MSSYFDEYEKIKDFYKRLKPGTKFQHKFNQNIIITIKSIWADESGIVIYKYDSNNNENWCSLELFINHYELVERSSQ